MFSELLFFFWLADFRFCVLYVVLELAYRCCEVVVFDVIVVVIFNFPKWFVGFSQLKKEEMRWSYSQLKLLNIFWSITKNQCEKSSIVRIDNRKRKWKRKYINSSILMCISIITRVLHWLISFVFVFPLVPAPTIFFNFSTSHQTQR